MPRRIMDYPSAFGGWHAIISGGHLLTVSAFICFVLALVDSFYEGRPALSFVRGVGRLGTRLAFYTYKARKLDS
jgi:heme/copper-type cytochrome/quinol oxidase subunit 1